MGRNIRERGIRADSARPFECAAERAVSLAPVSHFRALLGRAHAVAGDREKAQHILDDLLSLSCQAYVSPFDIAIVYAGLDDLESAFQWLEEAYRQRVFRIIELTFPMFDNLRSDARWQDLVRRIGLPTTVRGR